MSTTRCNKPAINKYFWPGRDPSHVCLEHVFGLLGIAQALGLYLPLQPPDEGATCDQILTIKEMDRENKSA